MKRWAASGLGILLLLSTTTTTSAAPAHAGTTAAIDAPAPPVMTASRAYGDGPVRLEGQSARITFTGRKGDVVHLDTGRSRWLKGSKTRLLAAGRTVPQTWTFYWRLPRTGRFTFSFEAADNDRPGRLLQLEKVHIARTELDGAPVEGRPPRRGYLNAVSVDLAPGERALLTSRDFVHLALTPGGDVERLAGDDLQLEVGRPIHTTIGDTSDTELSAGTLLVLGQGATSAQVTSSVVKPISTDGTVTQLTSDGRPREHVFTFDATDGDVVIPSFHGTPRWTRVFEGPDDVIEENAPSSGAYWVDGSGVARYSVITNGRSGRITRLSLTKALTLPALTTLDSPVTLASTTPGQYVAVKLPPYPSPTVVGLSATESAFTTSDGSTPRWSVHLEPAQPYYCLTDPHAPLGCGEYFPISIDQDQQSNVPEVTYGYTGNSLVLAVPPTVAGRVTITLTQQAPPL